MSSNFTVDIKEREFFVLVDTHQGKPYLEPFTDLSIAKEYFEDTEIGYYGCLKVNIDNQTAEFINLKDY